MRLWIALALTLVCSGDALADWSRSFAPQAVATYLDDAEDGRKVVVVAADSQSRGAAAALLEALKWSGRTDALLDGKQLGSVARLDDAAIVRKGAVLPIDLIGVVRVSESTAVVTFYNKQGGVVGAFTIEEGKDLMPRAELGAEPQAPRPDAQKEYNRRFIWFADPRGTTFGTAYEGRSRRPLSGEEFYNKVDRPDMAARYGTKNTARKVLLSTGSVLMGLGILGGGITVGLDSENGLLAGSVMFGTGIVGGLCLMLAGAFLNPHPVKPQEARDMASSFNRRLKQSLGLSF